MFLLAGVFLFLFFKKKKKIPKNKLLSTETQQQRMVVLHLGFWFCLKQSGQKSVLLPPLSQGALKPQYVVIASS